MPVFRKVANDLGDAELMTEGCSGYDMVCSYYVFYLSIYEIIAVTEHQLHIPNLIQPL